MIWRVGFKLVVSQKKKKNFFLKFPPPHQVIMSREHELINACWPAPADGRLRPQAARCTDRVHGPGTALSGDPRGQRLSFAFSPTTRVHASSESRKKIEWTPGAGAPPCDPPPDARLFQSDDACRSAPACSRATLRRPLSFR